MAISRTSLPARPESMEPSIMVTLDSMSEVELVAVIAEVLLLAATALVELAEAAGIDMGAMVLEPMEEISLMTSPL